MQRLPDRSPPEPLTSPARPAKRSTTKQRIFRTVTQLMYQNANGRRPNMRQLLQQSGRKSLSSFYRHYADLEQVIADYLEHCRRELRQELARAQGQHSMQREQSQANLERAYFRTALSLLWRHQNLYWGLEAQGNRWLLELIAAEISPYIIAGWPPAARRQPVQTELMFQGLFVGVVRSWFWQTHGDRRALVLCAERLQRLSAELCRVLLEQGAVQYLDKRRVAVRPKDAFPLDASRRPGRSHGF